MTPEEKSLLERTHKIAEDNNVILRGIRRANRISTVMRILYWLIIVGVTLGAFYYLQPYIDSMFEIIDKAQESIQSMGGTVREVQGAFSSTPR
jgi:hypothetical protein